MIYSIPLLVGSGYGPKATCRIPRCPLSRDCSRRTAHGKRGRDSLSDGSELTVFHRVEFVSRSIKKAYGRYHVQNKFRTVCARAISLPPSALFSNQMTPSLASSEVASFDATISRENKGAAPDIKPFCIEATPLLSHMSLVSYPRRLL